MKENYCKGEVILIIIGHVCLSILLGIMIGGLLWTPPFINRNKTIDRANAVIQECIEQYPDFYDTIGEGDAWCEHSEDPNIGY